VVGAADATVRWTIASAERRVSSCRSSAGRRGRIIDNAHFAGVAGSTGRVMASSDEVDAPVAMSALLRPPAEYEAVAGGAW